MNNVDCGALTIRHAQLEQPWTLPLSPVNETGANPNIWGEHAVIHAAKSVGKLASVFEALDHSGLPVSTEQRDDIAAMAADLTTISLRFANLYGFDLATVLYERVLEKNNMPIPAWN